MTRLHTVAPDQAGQEAAELFGIVKRNIGKVPNVYATIGSNAPAVLAHMLDTGATLAKSSLSRREQEAINLAVSEATGCDYCVAAHTMTGKMAGYTAEQTRELRSGAYVEDARIDALVKFALQLVQQRGTLDAAAVDALKAAGFDDRQLVEIPLVVSAILLTNMVNRINDTTLDFPRAA
ncbi:carboxymuconolactone decarboxylase family protein [Rhodanobacter spathiphylli]|uniref:Alkylhydroperoxidase AhpD core n=1 Tax=Rhodanobacter spathiphylli B39 TaxID=1163407 RepID=I4VWE8_9GAMM|nr:carboxymuconolactone decarboxylase family protein [Rhodanobacter spathiphylli]EIL91539.1 alkylhydroperoxidase AhpD core [Rhodanobacter spathiphylli B39]